MTIKEFVSTSLQNFHSVIAGIYQKKNDIVDNLTSTDTTNPLSANQGKELKSYVDSIDTYCKYLCTSYTGYNIPPNGQSGWYRIASYISSNNNTAMGANGSMCEIIIRRAYNNLNNEVHCIRFAGVFQKSKFASVMNLSNSQVVTKIRHTVDTTNTTGYIEIYISSGSLNGYGITIQGDMNFGTVWTSCGIVATSETVDGVTVVSSMDIPAND